MSEIKRRIRLALAMGWQRVGRTAETALYYPPGTKSYGPLGNDEPPDPFTDANDDYAVLRWMRAKWTDQNLIDALESLPFGNHMDAYQIGDFARAALKELDTDREGHQR